MMLNDEERWSLERLGFLYYHRERLEEARAIFEGLTAADPRGAYAWFGLALVARQLGDRQAALDLAAHAVTLAPERVDFRVALGELRMEAGDTAGALRTLAPLRNRPPVLPAHRRGLALLERWSRG